MHALVWSLLLETDVGAKYENMFNYIRIAAWNQNVLLNISEVHIL